MKEQKQQKEVKRQKLKERNGTVKGGRKKETKKGRRRSKRGKLQKKEEK